MAAGVAIAGVSFLWPDDHQIGYALLAFGALLATGSLIHWLLGRTKGEEQDAHRVTPLVNVQGDRNVLSVNQKDGITAGIVREVGRQRRKKRPSSSSPQR